MIGRIGVCSQGRLGRITGRQELVWGISWVGVGFDGMPWASRNPQLLSQDEQEAMELTVGTAYSKAATEGPLDRNGERFHRRRTDLAQVGPGFRP